jgi:hypothetical protein
LGRMEVAADLDRAACAAGCVAPCQVRGEAAEISVSSP